MDNEETYEGCMNQSDRLLRIMEMLDPSETETSEEVTTYDPNTGKKLETRKITKKPKYEHVQSLWLNFEENDSKKRKEIIENKKLDLEDKKIDIEEKRLDIQEKEKARELDYKEAELELKKEEAKEHRTYTKGQAVWEITKIGFKGAVDILGMAVGIGMIIRGENAGCLIGGQKTKYLKTKINF